MPTWRWLAALLLSTAAAAAQRDNLQGDNPLSLKSQRAPHHVTVNAGVGRPAPLAGSTVRVFVDIVANPGIRVYAPGAKDYAPVALVITPQTGIRVGRTIYPKSSIAADPLGKAVPVYVKGFRVARDVTLSPTIKKGRRTLFGRVEYQACDDRLCYAPASIPVTWTVTVR